MKKHLFLLIAALMAMGQNAFAYDFSAVSPSGHTLYYKIIDSVNHYVMLTYPNDINPGEIPGEYNGQVLWAPNPMPAGALILPDTVLFEEISYNVRVIGQGAFRDCPITSVVMPNSIDSVGLDAFGGCQYLTSVTFSNTLRYINGFAFMGCHLGDVVFPASLRVLGESAFNSSNITSITLNDSIEILEGKSLANNPFTSLYIPASVNQYNGACAPDWGNHLTSIVVDPNNPIYDSRNNCNAIIKTYENILIQACNNTTIPDGIVKIGGFDGTNFETLIIPNSVLEIQMYWAHVNRLVLSSPQVFIDWNSFGGIDTIQFLNENPPTITVDQYTNWSKPIIVPCNTLLSYQSAPIWNNFTNMMELGTPQITVNAENGSATVEAYPSCGNDTATVSATADTNYHFVRWSDGSTQNPYTLVLTGNTTLTAIFAIDSVLVRATPANPLKGAVMGGSVVPLNSTTTLTAIPSGSNVFLTWSNGVTDNPYTLTATSDTTLQAYFTLPDTLIFRDTINHYIHDTTFINNYVHDTLIQYVNQYIHDTTFVNNYIHDTVRITTQLIDTTIVNVYQFDTAIYNTYHYDTLIINNHYYDTVFITTHHYDTIYITEEGIDGVESINAKVYSNRGQVVVEGAAGNMVTLYDVTGRVLATRQDNYTPMRFDAPASGTYMIKIGNYPARKVVVIR